MKKRDLKEKILDAYRSETPDLCSKVLDACAKEAQEPKSAAVIQVCYQAEKRKSFHAAFKRVAAAALCMMLFLSGFSVGFFIPNDEEAVVPAIAETVIYLDVNPSVELQIDSENKIVDVIAGNEDANIVLADLELDGIDVNTALKAIVGSMYVNGYLTEASNSILVSVNSENEQTADALLGGITEKINAVFENSEMECAIITQCISVDEDLVGVAAEYGVSVGKMHFLNKIAESFQGLSLNALDIMSEMSINDLNLIYSQKTGTEGEAGHEVIQGEAKINIKSEEALERVLMQIGKTKDDVSSFCVFLRPSKTGNAKAAYGISLELHNDLNIYRYEVDCQTGEVFMILTFATLTSEGVVYRDILYRLDSMP